MYNGYIVVLKYLRPHPNADRLQIATVFNEDVIVDLSYKEGDRCVYFPSDGQLGSEFCEANNLVRKKDENGNNIGGYLDPDKRNVKAIKLRGHFSDGLLLPITSLEKFTDIEKLQEGSPISEFNGIVICKKYIPKTNKRRTYNNSININKKEQKETKSYPFFLEHKDTQQLRFCTDKFKVGDLCTITLKMHGTSARTSNAVEIVKKKYNWVLKKLLHKEYKITKSWNLISGSRRVVLKNDNYNDGYYGNNLFRKQYHDYLIDKLPKGMTIYYEIVGYVDDTTPIMATCNNSKISDPEFKKQYGDETIFHYGCSFGNNDCYVYRITMQNEDGVAVELSWSDVQVWCEKLGLKPVPTFETFLFTTVEDLWNRVYKYYDGPDPIGKTHIKEGVVVRIENRNIFTAYKCKNDNFKILEGIMKENANAPDIEEAQEELIEYNNV